ncbi:hypothetical protein J6590_016502 [Homalodisca vitripennis]|nr:hypothetical protein J6590_016502 [Homalodisca vitripennis]
MGNPFLFRQLEDEGEGPDVAGPGRACGRGTRFLGAVVVVSPSCRKLRPKKPANYSNQ